jgi:hypothetical protein
VRRRRKVSVYIVLVVKFISDFFKESKIGDHQERLCVLMCSQQLFWGETASIQFGKFVSRGGDICRAIF